MSETTDERWLRWDELMNKGDYYAIIKEFDKMLLNGRPVVGDLIRRDRCLEAVGVISLSPNAMAERKYNNGKRKIKK